MSDRARPPALRRLLIAALAIFHAAAVCASSIPSAGQGISRSNWSDPTVQGEFDSWARLLGVESEWLQDWAHAGAVKLADARRLVLVPFDDYLDATGTRQGWKMFVGAHRFPTRGEIAVREGLTWTTVFRERDPEASWRAERFDTERMRASIFAWGWPSGSKRWTSACNTFAAELFEERPGIDAVRCQFIKARTPTAAEVRAGTVPEGEAVFVRVVTRE